MNTRIAIESPSQPDVVALIEALDAYQKPLYPEESHHGIDIAALSQPNVCFVVARDTEGRAVACGAIVQEPQYAELKRMFVHPEQRGKGLGKALLEFLEAQARGHGCERVMLETGIYQPEALALYQNAGYERCGPFGSYTTDPNSVYLQKILLSRNSATRPG